MRVKCDIEKSIKDIQLNFQNSYKCVYINHNKNCFPPFAIHPSDMKFMLWLVFQSYSYLITSILMVFIINNIMEERIMKIVTLCKVAFVSLEKMWKEVT